MKTNFFYLLILAFLCVTLTNSQAQFEGFDLSTYKNPDYKRQQLDLNVNMQGYNSNIKPSGDYFKNLNYSNYDGQLQLNYSKILNTRKLQQEWGILLSEIPYYSSNKTDYTDNTKTNYSTTTNEFNINLGSTNRFYLKDITFLEFGLNGAYSNNYSKTNSTDDHYTSSNKEYKTKNTNVNASASLRIGKGRIEYIEDARLAIYILDDLNKHGRLSRTPTDEEILAFSKIITQIKNQRFFDARQRKIAEITKVDSFMQANNLITKPDAAYFTTVTDNWDNASGPERTSGVRYSLGISPQYNYLYEYNHTSVDPYDGFTYIDYTIKPFNYRIPIDYQIEYNKPLNLHWQLSAAFNLGYAYSKGKMQDNTNRDLQLDEVSSKLLIKTGLYPNSRTYWESSLSLQFENLSSKLTTEESPLNEKGTYQSLFPTWSISGHQYLSPQLQVSIYYGISYFKPTVKNDFTYFNNDAFPYYKEINQNFSITLTYMLF